MSNRVRIGTCAGPADAALVRSAFAAHDLRVVIGHENFANVLGGLGGSFVSLDIFVAEEDAEDAAALLHDLRAGDHEAGPDAGEAADPDSDEHADAEGVWQTSSREEASAEDDDAQSSAPIELSSDRRRRTAIALLLAFCVGFGTAHLYTRAWLRGMMLAGLEILGFTYVASGSKLGVALVMGAVICDAVGGVVRASKPAPPRLPAARVHS